MSAPCCSLYAAGPTPVFDTPDVAALFGRNPEGALPLDAQGLMRRLELIALPGQEIAVVAHHSPQIVQVCVPGYDPASRCYTDKRFLTAQALPLSVRLPPAAYILESLTRRAEARTRYLWGGNWHAGIPALLDLYPPPRPLSDEELLDWTLTGVDCSGLLYEAAVGCTPRNTSSLLNFGQPVDPAGGTIAASLRPLDLLVWKGHVVIVFSEEETIESSADKRRRGVTRQPLDARLDEIMNERRFTAGLPGSEQFTVRRWHPDRL